MATYQELIAAVEAGNIEEVRQLLDQGVPVNPASANEASVLAKACAVNNTEIAKLLIAKGADISLRDSNRQTVLDSACIRGNRELIKLLLDKAQAHQDKQALLDSALRHAAKYGQEGIVRLLLQQGAKPDARDEYGNTALDLVNYKLGKNISIFTMMKRHPTGTAVLLLIAIFGLAGLTVGIGGLAGMPVLAGLATHWLVEMVVAGAINTIVALSGFYIAKKLQTSAIKDTRDSTVSDINTKRQTRNTEAEIQEQLQATAKLLEQADFSRAEKAKLALTALVGAVLIGGGVAALSSAVVMSTLSFGLPTLGLGLAIGAIAMGALAILAVGITSYSRYQQHREVYAVEMLPNPEEQQGLLNPSQQPQQPGAHVPSVPAALTGLGTGQPKKEDGELDLTQGAEVYKQVLTESADDNKPVSAPTATPTQQNTGSN